MRHEAKDWKAVVRELADHRGWTLDRVLRRAADWADERYPGERGLGYSNLSKRLSPKDAPKQGVDLRIFEAFAGAFEVDPAAAFLEYRLRTMDLTEAAAALAAYEKVSRPAAQVAAEAGQPSAEPTGRSRPSAKSSRGSGQAA